MNILLYYYVNHHYLYYGCKIASISVLWHCSDCVNGETSSCHWPNSTKKQPNCCAQFIFSSAILTSARNWLLVYWNVCSTTDSWRVILFSCYFFLVDWHQAKRCLVFEIDQTLVSILFNSLFEHFFLPMSFHIKHCCYISRKVTHANEPSEKCVYLNTRVVIVQP